MNSFSNNAALTRTLRCLKLVLTAGIALGGVAIAADNCSGTYHNVGNMADTQDIGGGVKLTAFSALSSNQFKDGEMRGGACSGYVINLPDGKARAVYACARKNKSGDVAIEEGSFEPGAERGTWKITSATGALAKTIGDSGWWHPVVENGKVVAGVWGGNCK